MDTIPPQTKYINNRKNEFNIFQFFHITWEHNIALSPQLVSKLLESGGGGANLTVLKDSAVHKDKYLRYSITTCFSYPLKLKECQNEN
jgi:hypothetical protein